jgi:hypothetical protein
MGFSVDAIRGAGPGLPGQVDYRLARQHVVAEFKRGRLSRLDVCDAHPELLRNALALGEAVDQPCPICEDQSLVHVTYVFGPRLPPSGRCITTKAELAKLGRSRSASQLAAYVVEVCPECSWNHLARTFVLGSAHSG